MFFGLYLLIPPNPETTVKEQAPAQERRNLINPAAHVVPTSPDEQDDPPGSDWIDIELTSPRGAGQKPPAPPSAAAPSPRYAAKLERARRASQKRLRGIHLAHPVFSEAPIPVVTFDDVQVHASAMDFNLAADAADGRMHVRRPNFSLLPPVVTTVDETAALLALESTLQEACQPDTSKV